jgi:predicted acetyltransferase
VTIVVRPFGDGFSDRESALRALLDVDESAFGEAAGEGLDSPHLEVLEEDRTLLAWDGNQVVGASSVYTLDISTPGGSVPTAGVTWVGVRPTHRRQGAMRSMLAQLHAQASERHEPVAALWAAQSPIYQRFGYGVASRLMRTVIPRSAGALFRAPTDESIRLHMVAPAEDRELTQQVYDAMRTRRPGFPLIDEKWHRRLVDDPADQRGGASPLTTVVVMGESGPRGYVRYALKPNWSEGYADGTVQVRHMLALDPPASATLWRYLIEFDLFGRVEAWNTPIDDPLQHWIEEPRRGTRQVEDQLYVKLLDMGSALTRRTYSVPVDIVLEVHDDDVPANAGRWRLSGDTEGAVCERTNDPADLSMDVRSVGAVYLGGPTLLDHQAAGWVEELTPGAVSVASAAFAHHPAPHSPFVF